MISGINLLEVVDFTLQDDKENPTVWKLGIIPSDILSRVSLMLQNSEKQADAMFIIVRIGIKGWTNLADIEFSTAKDKIFGQDIDTIPMDTIKRIPVKVLLTLSTKLFEINNLSEKEQKN